MRVLFFKLFIGSYVIAFSQQVDYGNPENWAVKGNKTPEILKQFIKDTLNLNKADVFYVYPTVFLDKNDDRWNINMGDSLHKVKVLERAIKFQASAWAESGRMFAPFYRQAHLRSFRYLENGGREAILFAYEDVRNAFQYYLDNYNQGKPIILAGHSQGSLHIARLLKEFFDEKPLQKQLVIAYIPGIGVKKNEFKTIPLLTKENEVGGFVTWNTFKKKINMDRYEMWYKGKAVINPVTWSIEKQAERGQHKGFLFSNNKLYKHSFSTHLIDGAVWISRPHFPYWTIAWSLNDYHIGDVNLFWEDVKVNSKLRLSVFLDNLSAK
jgi:hypothetical protein